MTTLNEYQTKTRETAIYPEALTGSIGAITYVALGLLDEMGEVLSCLSAGDSPIDLRVDVLSVGSSDEGVRDHYLAEVGDVMWYLARLADEMGLELDNLLDEEQVELFVKWPWPERESPKWVHEIQTLVTILTPVAGFVKKSIRDSAGILSPRAFEGIKQSLESALFAVATSMKYFAQEKKVDAHLGTVLDLNLEKLFSRKERGVLGGSGDNR